MYKDRINKQIGVSNSAVPKFVTSKESAWLSSLSFDSSNKLSPPPEGFQKAFTERKKSEEELKDSSKLDKEFNSSPTIEIDLENEEEK